jgi:hypothetical protein
MATKATPAKKVVPAKKAAPPKKQMFDKKAAPAKPVAKKTTVKGLSPKERATKIGEPYVEILSVELDPDNIGNGAFEIDWNELFLAKLIRAGYQGKTDADIVDNWFKTICRNILAEEYEQWEANQPLGDRPRVVERRELGDGKVEVS